MSRITKIIENYRKSPKNLPKSPLNVLKSPAHLVDIFLLGLKNSGSFVYFHIFFDEIISILLTVIKVTFLNPVNIYLQDVLLISACLVVIFGNSQ